MEHPTRKRVLETLQNGPMIQKDLKRAVGVKAGALEHHVRHLVKAGYVRRVQDGGRGTSPWLALEGREVPDVLEDPAWREWPRYVRRVAAILKELQAASYPDVVAALQERGAPVPYRKSTWSKSVKRLRDEGWITAKRQGRRVQYRWTGQGSG